MRRSFGVYRSGVLDRSDRQFAGAAIFLNVERHFLPFGQSVHPGALKRGRVDEYVFAAVVGLNESISFLIIIEFYDSELHRDNP